MSGMAAYKSTSLRLVALLLTLWGMTAIALAEQSEQRLLYVAEPGIRADLQYGGAGILVFDIDHDFRFVRRIATASASPSAAPEAIRGICGSAATKKLYFSTMQSMTCIDLPTDRILWQKSYARGCDRMSISPDGKTIFLPSHESDVWHVVDAASGEVLSEITTRSGSHNTVFAPDGKRVYLAGLHSRTLTIADASTHEAVGTVGPFGGNIRPFTVNGSGTLCFCCVDGLLGFEVGDLITGKLLHRVEVKGFELGATKRHGCPSHGIGMSPDGKEIWVCDGHNQRVDVFDATVMPPKPVASVPCRDEPSWITFGIDGRNVYPSTGEVIDASSKKVVAALKDEKGEAVESEKLLEIDFRNGQPIRAGDQFARGMAH